jgi:hypothetical protein
MNPNTPQISQNQSEKTLLNASASGLPSSCSTTSSLPSLSSSSLQDLQLLQGQGSSSGQFSYLDEYTNQTIDELKELLSKAQEDETLVKPTTEQMKILWDGFQTTVQSNCNFKDIFLQLSQRSQLITSQIPFQKSSKLDLIDFIPTVVLDERTKNILRDLSQLGEKTSSQFANSTVHFQHPFLINLALLRLYVMQSREGGLHHRSSTDTSASLHTSSSSSNSSPNPISEKFLSTAKYYLKYAADVYEDKHLYISSEDILLNELSEPLTHRVAGWTNVKIPRHIVFLDHLTQNIVISIRGTGSLSDILTDLHLDSIPFDILPKATAATVEEPTFEDEESSSRYQHLKAAFTRAHEALTVLGKEDPNPILDPTPTVTNSAMSAAMQKFNAQNTLYAHRGIAQSAFALLPGVLNAIQEGQQRKNGKYKDYGIVLTGHSLGGGTASLLALLLASQHQLTVKTFAFAPPPVLNNFPLPASISERCEIHSFINHHDIIPRASHSEILNMLSVLDLIDSMAWKAVDRTMLLMRGYLTDEERQLIHDCIHNKETNRDKKNYHDENEIEMIVPGKIYLFTPQDKQIETTSSPSSSASSSPTSVLQVEKSKRSFQKLSGEEVRESKGRPKNNSEIRYQIHSIPSMDSMSLYNGFFYTGDSMVSDHLVSSYLSSMINLRTDE